MHLWNVISIKMQRLRLERLEEMPMRINSEEQMFEMDEDEETDYLLQTSENNIRLMTARNRKYSNCFISMRRLFCGLCGWVVSVMLHGLRFAWLYSYHFFYQIYQQLSTNSSKSKQVFVFISTGGSTICFLSWREIF